MPWPIPALARTFYVQPLDLANRVRRARHPRVARHADGMAALGFDLHNSNLPLKYDFPVLIQNTLDWLLPAETTGGGDTEKLMPMAESDVRMVAPDDEADTAQTRSDQGRELTAILLAVFLVLLLAEMGVSRYVG